VTVYKRTFRVRTTGSKAQGNLRPDLDDLPKGLNMSVLEYTADERECTVILWCSDHAVLKTEDRGDLAKIDAYATAKGLVTTTHPLEPAIVGTIAVMLTDEEAKYVADYEAGNYDAIPSTVLERLKLSLRFELPEKRTMVVDEG